MIKILVMILLFSTFSHLKAQEKGIPKEYSDEIASEIGLWIADNSKYRNDKEPMEAYALEWKYGAHKNNTYGRLYGITGGKETDTYWEFHKYWDPQQQKLIVMQIGRDGTLGIGTSRETGENETELVQVFTSTDGSHRKVGHRTTKFGTDKEVGTSYHISEHNEWILDRTYTWEKKTEEQNDTQGIRKLSFLLGKWKATAADSSFTSMLEYKYSPNQRLVMATNHLYTKAGDLIGVYEGGYMVKGENLTFFLSGPHGELHEGTAKIDGKTIIHKARIYPGIQTKSYISRMELKNNDLNYYATYSKEEEVPLKIENDIPLVYKALK